jgi:hypothetical protein
MACIPRKTWNVTATSYRDPDHDPSNPEPSDDNGGDDPSNLEDDDADPDDDPLENPPPAMGPAAGLPMEEDDIINLLHRLGFTDEATALIIGDHGLSTSRAASHLCVRSVRPSH